MLCACLLLPVVPAWAEDDPCALPQFTETRVDIAAIYAALDHRTECRKNPDYLFWMGQALNSLHMYTEAIERLESALMLQPDNWQAMLEYMIALEGSGDLLSAQALREQMLEDQRIPPPVLAELAARGKKAVVLPTELGGRRRSVSLAMGYDNNLMASPTLREIELTLPGGRLPVTLADSARSREGMFWRLDARQQEQWADPAHGRVWHSLLAANVRWAPTVPDADYAALEARLENAALGVGPYAQGNLVAAFNRDGAFYQQLGIEAGRDAEGWGASCRLRAGAELQWQYYPVATYLDGRYVGGVLRNLCPDPTWKAELRIGQNYAANAERAGGDQQRMAIALSKTIQRGNHLLRIDFEHEMTRDRDGYSPILENNLKRSINRSLYRIEYTKRMFNVEFFGGLDISRQKSNLPIFETNGRMIYLGLRHLW